MNVSIKIGIRSPFWPPRIPRRFCRPRKTFGLSPSQWAARSRQLGIDGEPHPNCSCGTESRGACIVHSVALTQ